MKSVDNASVNNIVLMGGTIFLRIFLTARARKPYCPDREAKGRFGGQKSMALNLQDS
jgi:hypothetical protein